jgi:hypothetical protein
VTNALVSMVTMFWNLCLLRTGPEHMPTVPAFLVTVLVLDIALNVAALLPMGSMSGPAVGQIVSTVATFGVVTYALLSVKGLQSRFTATFIAIVGSDAIITLVQIPLLPIVLVLGKAVFFVALLAFFLWTLMVFGFILQRALEVRREIGLALALFMILVVVAVGVQVNPQAAA